MNLYFLFPNVLLLGKQEHSHAIYSSLYSVRKMASRESDCYTGIHQAAPFSEHKAVPVFHKDDLTLL